MAEATTLARPYAQAIFELALTNKTLPIWSKTLVNLLEIMNQESIKAISDSVKVSKQQLSDIIRDVCGTEVDDQGKNLIALLIENGRLDLLKDIIVVYEILRAEAESTIEAQVTTAFPLDQKQSDQIAKALKAKLGREVKIVSNVDKSIIGGAIVHAGDLVIDGSISGRLAKLGQSMNL